MKRLLLFFVTLLTVAPLLTSAASAAPARANGCSFLLKPIRDAQDAAAKQYLDVAWKAARAAAVDTRGAYSPARKLVALIKQSEPELTVKLGGKAQAGKGAANVVFVDPRSNKNRVVFWTHTRSTTLWEAVATQTSPLQFIHAGGC